jgi:hypothetical protein
VPRTSLQEPKFVREALHGELLPKLFDAALHPVQFPGFPLRASLDYAVCALEERVVELHAGAVATLTLGAAPPGALSPAASRGGGGGSGGGGGGGDSDAVDALLEGGAQWSVLGPRPNLPEAEVRRWGMAKRLQAASGGRSLRHCYCALLENRDDENDAILWLVTPGAGGASSDGSHLSGSGGGVRESSLSDLCAVESLELDEPLIADDASPARRAAEGGRGGAGGGGGKGRAAAAFRPEVVLAGATLPLAGARLCCSVAACVSL